MSQSIAKQQGVALVVSLIILVIVTIAGVATMESTGMQLKMSNGSRDRQQAFEAAESALRIVEQRIHNNVDNLAEWDMMYYECSGDQCFKPDCSSGRCFQGLWQTALSSQPEECQLVDKGTGSNSNRNGGGNNVTYTVPPPVNSPWHEGEGADYLNVWDDAGRHLILKPAELGSGFSQPVKYIVEFRCFAPARPEAPLDSSNNAQIFRITARSLSDSGRVEVMLQSTYKRSG